MLKVFGLVLLALLFITFAIAAEQKNEALYSWDFGRVKEGTILKHDFIFKNESKTLLTIKDINTSCGCTVSKVDKKTLLPQESTLIKVQLNTKGYSGIVKQYVYVNTDSVDNPVVRFIIKAEVAKGGT